MSENLAERNTLSGRIRAMADSFGLPRLIIASFLLLMFIVAPFVGNDFWTQISNVINRFSWNAILVLAMVPMIHSGCGLNFGLPLGIISGLLGATLSIELGFTGPLSFVMAILIATPFALLLGAVYGWLLNKIKGGEMMIATYVGFSSVSFMCMMWLLLPYHSPTMVWGLSGKGLRTTISLEGYYDQVLAITEELGMTDQVLIKSGRPLAEVRRKLSEHPHNMMYMPVISVAEPAKMGTFDGYVAAQPPQLAYELCFGKLNDNVRQAARRALASGSKIWVNTIWGSLCGEYDDDRAFDSPDPDAVYGPILDLGTSIIQTDRPEFLIRYLEKKGRRRF